MDGDVMLDNEEAIRASTSIFFQNLLTSDVNQLDEANLDVLPRIPSDFDCSCLITMPTDEEVKSAVFGIDGFSAAGPDGFSSLFYQVCWEFVKPDVFAAAEDFFNGGFMPRSFTTTSIVLLPKKPNPDTWSDYRPISLCNV